MKLLPSQRHEINELLRRGGLDPRQFTWVDEEVRQKKSASPDSDEEESETYTTTPRTRLTHTRGFYFLFQGSSVIYSPGKTGWEGSSSHETWWGKKRRFRKWARYLQREITSPDLWASAVDIGDVLPASTSAESGSESNTPFTDEERARISLELRVLVEHVFAEAGELSEQQRATIEDRVAYLAEAATRVGRLDWRAILITTLLQIATDAAMNPEGVRRLMHLALSALGYLFGAPPPQLSA